MKKIAIIALAMVLASPLFAESFGDRSNNWLQRDAQSESGSLRAAPTVDGDEDGPGENPSLMSTPVGGGLALLVLSGAGYALVKRRRK